MHKALNLLTLSSAMSPTVPGRAAREMAESAPCVTISCVAKGDQRLAPPIAGAPDKQAVNIPCWAPLSHAGSKPSRTRLMSRPETKKADTRFAASIRAKSTQDL